ncbi:hypothetical protein ACFFWE_37055 [Sphaerisporangium melleum]|uniref:hypothetical protein n=1 Tax=Sphaerisporangium melleum TaxID=321316 RepID=UPI0016642182|nr:hypothetical protein [Sphaerisporangium melleum]
MPDDERDPAGQIPTLVLSGSPRRNPTLRPTLNDRVDIRDHPLPTGKLTDGPHVIKAFQKLPPMMGEALRRSVMPTPRRIGRYEQALLKHLLRICDTLDLVTLGKSEVLPPTRISGDLPNGLLIQKQPRLGHTYRDGGDQRREDAERPGRFLNLGSAGVVTSVVGIPMHHQKIDRSMQQSHPRLQS